MTQGTIKKSATKPTTASNNKNTKSSSNNNKRKSHPTQIIKPKNASRAHQLNRTRKASAALTRLMERRLVDRAGHVELIGGGSSSGSNSSSLSKQKKMNKQQQQQQSKK